MRSSSRLRLRPSTLTTVSTTSLEGGVARRRDDGLYSMRLTRQRRRPNQLSTPRLPERRQRPGRKRSSPEAPSDLGRRIRGANHSCASLKRLPRRSTHPRQSNTRRRRGNHPTLIPASRWPYAGPYSGPIPLLILASRHIPIPRRRHSRATTTSIPAQPTDGQFSYRAGVPPRRQPPQWLQSFAKPFPFWIPPRYPGNARALWRPRRSGR